MKLVCLGAVPEAIRIIQKIQKMNSDFELIGFLDNDESKWGQKVFSYPIFGGMSSIPELRDKGYFFCNLITHDAISRYETTLELEKKGVITLNDQYLNDLSMLGDPTRVRSYAYKISDLTLKIITYANVILFFVLGFIVKPGRLTSLFRSLFFQEHTFRYEKSISKLLKSRKTLSKLLENKTA